MSNKQRILQLIWATFVFLVVLGIKWMLLGDIHSMSASAQKMQTHTHTNSHTSKHPNILTYIKKPTCIHTHTYRHTHTPGTLQWPEWWRVGSGRRACPQSRVQTRAWTQCVELAVRRWWFLPKPRSAHPIWHRCQEWSRCLRDRAGHVER